MVINCTSISGYEGEELDARSDEERDEDEDRHIINQVSLSNVSQLYIRALTRHAVLLCVLLFVFLYCVIVHCCTGMYPTTGTLISVDIKKITYIHHTEFV